MRALALVLALAACSIPEKHFTGDGSVGGDGGGSSDGSGSGSGISLADLPAVAQSAECAYLVRCELFPTVSVCMQTTQTETTYMLTMANAVSAGNATYDPVLAKTCLDAFTNRTCNFTGVHADPNDPCNHIFTGKVAVGGTCFEPDECMGGGQCQYPSGCDPQTMCCAGACQAPPTQVGLNQPCQSSQQCMNGLYCRNVTSPPTCQPLFTQAGQNCDTFDSCADPMVCNTNAPAGVPKTCYVPPAEGQPCQPNAPVPCLDNRDYCDTSGAQPICSRDVPVGQACMSGTAQRRCVAYATCTNGACTQNPGLNQNCTPTTGCMIFLQCNPTVALCQQPPALTCM